MNKGLQVQSFAAPILWMRLKLRSWLHISLIVCGTKILKHKQTLKSSNSSWLTLWRANYFCVIYAAYSCRYLLYLHVRQKCTSPPKDKCHFGGALNTFCLFILLLGYCMFLKCCMSSFIYIRCRCVKREILIADECIQIQIIFKHFNGIRKIFWRHYWWEDCCYVACSLY